MRDALHKTLKPIKDRVGLWWIRFWKWPEILRECYAEICQLESDLTMVREQFRTGQSIRETLEKIANESREAASVAMATALTEKTMAANLAEELGNAKVQLQKSSETVGGLEHQVARMEVESERLKAELAKTQADLTRSGLELDREKRGQQEARRDLTLLREFVHRTHRLDIPTRRGIKAMLANGSRLTVFLAFLLPICLFAQFPPPILRGPFTTNTAAWANTNVISLSTTNATSKPLTNHYQDGVLTLFGLEAGANITLSHNPSNIVITGSGGAGDAGGTNARQFGTLTLTNLSGTGAVTNVVSLSTTNAISKPITNHFENGILTLFGIEQGSGHLTTVNESNIVTANDWVQTASTTNVIGVSNWVNSVSNYSNTKQHGTASLTNLSGNPNVATNILGTGFVTVSSNNAGTWTITGTASGETNFNGEVSITNATRIGLVNGKVANTNLLRSVQGGNGIVLTNEGTNVMFAIDPLVVASQADLTTASNTLNTAIIAATNSASVTNWINFRQPANAVLSNLVVTVSNNVTNVVSLSTTNATSKPLTNSYTAGVLTLFGLEAGANITLTPNESNIVVASTASGGLTTNASQFLGVPLSLRDGVTVTNPNSIGILHITNTAGADRAVRFWNTNGLGYSEFGVVTQAWLPTNKFLFSITNPAVGEVLEIQSVSIVDGVAAIVITNAPDNSGGGGLTTNANQFGASVELTIKTGSFLTNMNYFGTGTNDGDLWIDGNLLPIASDTWALGNTAMPFGAAWLGNDGLNLLDDDLSAFVTLLVPASVTSYDIIFPDAQGADGQTLTNNGSGTLGWWTPGGPLGFNPNQFASNGNLVSIKSGALLTNTLFYPSNLTGPAIIATATTAQVTNLVEWRSTNGAIEISVSSNANAIVYGRLDMSNAVAFRTNNIDFRLPVYQAFTNALQTNLVLQLTNVYEGVTHRIDAYGAGRLGNGRTNAWQIFCTVAANRFIYWPPGTTNGNFDVLVNSNQIVSFTFMGGLGSTNILAAYRVLEGIGAN